MKSLLLHVCCGPCALMPLLRLREAGFNVIGYFYNPNIHPIKEYLRRREAMQAVASHYALPMLWDDDYDSADWLSGALTTSVLSISQSSAGELSTEVRAASPRRCSYCYALRLQRCRQKAQEAGFAFFSSSLLYSRRQQHERIKSLAQGLSAPLSRPLDAATLAATLAPKNSDHTGTTDTNTDHTNGPHFYYQDFREDWQSGINLSKELGLYRQNYCGCLFSENERFIKEFERAVSPAN